ncbi:uroporphyrinogen decarboxylase [Ruficoccus amylovorans]|uniref:Uroporphyrinogen decarboxylase n=1 Tax=Ruficoccus amylovorans TaxID=1804625 RepID=A0A842HDI2_9BACT|nr:uroporphyrinogen decarboxylase [Ruficoccus amylovorans]MBC2594108.1 uroporphyrinogen decarboxylase [Ruficoccus amylovorans]
MTSRERFLAAVRGEVLDRPPMWLMRQAGRYLPEYRALKQKHDFLTLAKTPALATEVTLQPIRRYGFDAAIIFSDILVIPEAMGQPYHFRDQGGIGMDYALETAAQIDALTPEAVRERLNYVAQALRQTRAELGPDHALLGFGGSPWTLAAYMIEGGSAEGFPKLLALLEHEPVLFGRLMEKLCAALAEYFQMQIEAGADAIQIFDSWAALAPQGRYEEVSVRWICELIRALPADFPVILYAKGRAHERDALVSSGAAVLSLDWTVNLPRYRDGLANPPALQGNLDPAILDTTEEATRSAVGALLESMRGQGGYIFNLGHGIHPQAKVENVAALVDTVKSFR